MITALLALALQSVGSVEEHALISSDVGLLDTLDESDRFGIAMTSVGDLDGNGVPDLAVGASQDADGGPGLISNRGAVWILFLQADGSLLSHAKISAVQGGFTGALDENDQFGFSVAALGDLDGDGVTDLAVGAEGDDDGADDAGAVWILFLDADGSVKSHQKISNAEGGFTGSLDDNTRFGSSLAALGDVDGDGVTDLAVGARYDLSSQGSAFVVLLHADGTVKLARKLTDGVGGFTGDLSTFDQFGCAVAGPGDVNGDGVPDLAVGSDSNEAGGSVWLAFLAPDGTAQDQVEIQAADGLFGTALASPGDLDDNGVPDLVVTAEGHETGALFVLGLAADGSVLSTTEISASAGGLQGPIDGFDDFATSVASLGDLDGDGDVDLAVGAPGDDFSRGAAWILRLTPGGAVADELEISDVPGSLLGTLDTWDHFGSGVAWLGDLDGDGHDDLAVGAPGDDDAIVDGGAVWILFLDAAGEVDRSQKISGLEGNLGIPLFAHDQFGLSLAALGDLDGDRVTELAVGAHGDSTHANWETVDRGVVWILFLEPDGTVKDATKIAENTSGFDHALDFGDRFGAGLVALGGNRLAVGTPGDDDETADSGCVWMLFLAPDGTVAVDKKISNLIGSLDGPLDAGDRFGSGLAAPGDVDGDGFEDLAVGTPGDDDAATDAGSVWILFLNSLSLVGTETKVGGLAGLNASDGFGSALARLGDLDGNGLADLAVGAPGDDEGPSIPATDRGAVWVLGLDDAGGLVSQHEITATEMGGLVLNQEEFGTSVSSGGDGPLELLVGVPFDDDGGIEHGALWLLDLHGSPWTALGSGLAGVAGVPHLAGTGELAASTPGSLVLSSAAPSASSLLFVSLLSFPAPFKGGTLVPVPPLFGLGLATNGTGQVALPFLWPTGVPASTEIFFQYGVQDAAATHGVALSNALRATTP